MGNIKKLADKSNNAKLVSVQQMLENVLERVDNELAKYDKGIVILLNTHSKNFSVQHFYSNLDTYETIALVEIVKGLLMDEIVQGGL